MKTKQTAIVLLSGGLDSATSAAQAIADGHNVIAISFVYGQRHIREIESSRKIAKLLGISEHYIVEVDLSKWGGSSLTDLQESLPKQETSSIPSTYVPGRNTVFLSIVLSLAESKEARFIYLGINAVDYSGYPDCRPEYLEAFQKLASLSSRSGVQGKPPVFVAPLIHDSKEDIVRRALSLGVPIRETWSCYEGGSNPCGNCDSCKIRNNAFIQIGRTDLVSP